MLTHLQTENNVLFMIPLSILFHSSRKTLFNFSSEYIGNIFCWSFPTIKSFRTFKITELRVLIGVKFLSYGAFKSPNAFCALTSVGKSSQGNNNNCRTNDNIQTVERLHFDKSFVVQQNPTAMKIIKETTLNSNCCSFLCKRKTKAKSSKYLKITVTNLQTNKMCNKRTSAATLWHNVCESIELQLRLVVPLEKMFRLGLTESSHKLSQVATNSHFSLVARLALAYFALPRSPKLCLITAKTHVLLYGKDKSHRRQANSQAKQQRALMWQHRRKYLCSVACVCAYVRQH